MAIAFRKEVKVEFSKFKDVNSSYFGRATLSLSPSGDLQLLEKKDKLSQQLLRAIVNEDVFKASVNSQSTKAIAVLINNILRNFKQTQIGQTNSVDANLTGYNLYKYGGNFSEFTKVNVDPITNKFTDTDVYNGITYTYGVTKLYNGRTESALLEQLICTPNEFHNNLSPSLGQFFSILPRSSSVDIHVIYNDYFAASELLDSIDTISVNQSTDDPRRFTVNIIVKDYSGNLNSIFSESYNITK